jgi:G3E family GTPase
MQAGPQFVIVSGALGSGKTSLLEMLLSCEDASDTAVIVNEAGEINIDGAILSESARGMTMATLSNGCVCCSMTSDLVSTVQDLVQSREAEAKEPFARIVLECSGLSRPGPIVSTYDCSRPAMQTGDFEDAVAQLAAANTIVLTKVDLVSSGRRDEALQAVVGVNPFAQVVNEFSASVRAREAFSTPGHGNVAAIEVPGVTPQRRRLLHPRTRVFRAKLGSDWSWDGALDWLENIAGALGDRLLRIKAIVPGERPGDRVLLQSVGTTFSAPRRLLAGDAAPMGAVVIARDCGRADLSDVPTEQAVNWVDYQ